VGGQHPGIVIKFFVAPDAEAAAAVAEGGPDGVFESLTVGAPAR